MVDAKFGSKFFDDLVLSPFGVICGHPLDEADVHLRNPRAAWLGFVTPERLVSLKGGIQPQLSPSPPARQRRVSQAQDL